MEATTGSLGQGISHASGIAMALRLKRQTGRVVVFLSDGECESGEFWEAVQAAAFHRQDNLLLLIDRNGCQCDGAMKVSKAVAMRRFYSDDAAFLIGGSLFTSSPDLSANCRTFREKLESGRK